MTDSLRYLYQYIINYKRHNDGNTPTIREICTDCGISSNSVAVYRLRQLESANLIKRRDGKIFVIGATWTPPE